MNNNKNIKQQTINMRACINHFIPPDAVQADRAHYGHPHNHTDSPNKGSLGAFNDYTQCIHKSIVVNMLQIQFSIIKWVDLAIFHRSGSIQYQQGETQSP